MVWWNSDEPGRCYCVGLPTVANRVLPPNFAHCVSVQMLNIDGSDVFFEWSYLVSTFTFDHYFTNYKNSKILCLNVELRLVESNKFEYNYFKTKLLT